jgi:hypothetical protein
MLKSLQQRPETPPLHGKRRRALHMCACCVCACRKLIERLVAHSLKGLDLARCALRASMTHTVQSASVSNVRRSARPDTDQACQDCNARQRQARTCISTHWHAPAHLATTHNNTRCTADDSTQLPQHVSNTRHTTRLIGHSSLIQCSTVIPICIEEVLLC